MQLTPHDLHSELKTALLRAMRYPSTFSAEQLRAMQVLYALLEEAKEGKKKPVLQ